jgi:hypothetical protein
MPNQTHVENLYAATVSGSGNVELGIGDYAHVSVIITAGSYNVLEGDPPSEVWTAESGATFTVSFLTCPPVMNGENFLGWGTPEWVPAWTGAAMTADATEVALLLVPNPTGILAEAEVQVSWSGGGPGPYSLVVLGSS